MTTTGIESWAVDLADVGAIYPFQGMEFVLLLIGLVFWIWWHVWSIRHELAVQEEQIKEHGSAKSLESALDMH